MSKSGGSRESQPSQREPGRGTLTSPTAAPAASSPEPGKSTAVQRKADGASTAADPVGVAQKGVGGGGGGSLPYLKQIQSSFGRHDVSGVQAHQGGAAATASSALGARAYAVGNSVAFKGAPDLHTAAHEAAHVVQNRGGVSLKGLDGGSGDAHEQHADAVADAVVGGKSAEGLLDKGAGGAGGATVQRAKGDKPAGPAGPAGPAPAERAPSGATAALMLQITPEWAAGMAAGSKGTGHDEELKGILLHAFEANWFKAKDCLLFDRWPIPKTAPDRPTHAAQGELMQALVNMRSRICDGIAAKTQLELPARLKLEATAAKAAPKPAPADSIENVADQFHAEAHDANITPAQHTTFMPPAGAQKKTSDIDVSTGGKNTEIAVKLYNEIFRRDLAVPFDPATVFDYNVYSSDWIHKANFKNENTVTATEIDPATKMPKAGAAPKQVATRVTPQPEHVISGAGDKEKDAAANATLQQDRAQILDETSLLHIRRNCHGPDWKQYVKGRVDAEPDPAQKRLLTAKLAAVDLKYKQFAAEVATRSGTVATQMATTLAAFDHVSDWGAKNKHFQDEAVQTRASNELYQEKLRAVKALRLQYAEIAAKAEKSETDIEQLMKIAKDVTAALGDAFFFANEVYASEGAVLHTVVGIQGATNDAKKFGIAKIDVVLTPDHYMQSFNENVGDSLHQLEHYKQDEAYAIYRAGKYIDRMIQAADALCGKEEAAKHTKYLMLAELAAKAVAVKGTDAGDDPVEIKKKFPEASKTGIGTLRSSVINFGADIPALAKKVEEKKHETATKAKPATPAQKPVDAKPPTFETASVVTAPIRVALDSLRASVDAAADKGKKGT